MDVKDENDSASSAEDLKKQLEQVNQEKENLKQALREARDKNRAALRDHVGDSPGNGKDEELIPLDEDLEGGLEQRVGKLMNSTTARFLDLSEDLARDTFEDYDEVKDGYIEQVKSNPAELQAILASANPAKELYKRAKARKTAEEIGNPEEFRKKLLSELRAELAGDDSLTSEANASGASKRVETGANDLEDLFPT